MESSLGIFALLVIVLSLIDLFTKHDQPTANNPLTGMYTIAMIRRDNERAFGARTERKKQAYLAAHPLAARIEQFLSHFTRRRSLILFLPLAALTPNLYA